MSDVAAVIVTLGAVLALVFSEPLFRRSRQRRYDEARAAGYRGLWPPPPPGAVYPPLPPAPKQSGEEAR